MAENPLLPHRKLRELHTLMLRGRELERKQGRAAREGLLAATAMQLLAGDVLCPDAGDGTAAALLPKTAKTGKAVGVVAAGMGARLAASAGVALGLRTAGTDGLVLTFLRAGVGEPDWAATLAWAQERQLPLIVACEDAMGRRVAKVRSGKGPEAVTWAAIGKVAKRLRLPVVSVDGEDAVAVYRVMQEAVIRARSGAGPALIWAAMGPGGKVARSAQPVARLESYLAARRIALPKTARRASLRG